jgi:hypothetical protein
VHVDSLRPLASARTLEKIVLRATVVDDRRREYRPAWFEVSAISDGDDRRGV